MESAPYLVLIKVWLANGFIAHGLLEHPRPNRRDGERLCVRVSRHCRFLYIRNDGGT